MRQGLLALILIFSAGCSKPANPVVTVTPTPTLDQQRMCADQSKKMFDESEKEALPAGTRTISSNYTDHFDVNATTCYVEIVSSWTDRGAAICDGKTVSDAFEGHVFATYIWCSDKKKKYWEVAPLECKVKTRQLPEAPCHSGDDFDKFVSEHFGTGE